MGDGGVGGEELPALSDRQHHGAGATVATR